MDQRGLIEEAQRQAAYRREQSESNRPIFNPFLRPNKSEPTVTATPQPIPASTSTWQVCFIPLDSA